MMLITPDTASEVCTCKHTRAAHCSGFAHCVARKCKCARFTWDSRNRANVERIAEAVRARSAVVDD